MPRWPSSRRRSTVRPTGDWVERSPFAKSTRGPATAASWKSTLSNNVLYDLERFGHPFCRFAAPCRCTARDRSRHHQHARSARAHLPGDAHIRNGWSRWGTVGETAASSPAATPASAASAPSCPSTCTSAAARRRRSACSKVCSHCSSASTTAQPLLAARRQARVRSRSRGEYPPADSEARG